MSERAGHPPLVSVVVPGRDAVGFLGDTLVSLERQLDDPSQLEVIFVDDASGDGTAEVIAAHGELAMPVRVLQTGRPVGVSAARNLGLQVAEGQFLGFLDADDWFAPRHLQRLADALAHLECDFVRTDLVLVNGRARTVVRAPESRRGVVLPSLSGILPVSSRSMVDHPSMFAGLFHRRLVDRGLLCFDETLSSAEDREQMWRLHLATDTFAVVDAPGAFYRRGLASSLTQVRDERRLGYLDAFESVRCIVAQHPHGEELSEKAAQTVLALTAQHLARESDRGMLRRQLVGGALALLRRFPEATVRACVRRLDGERRQLLAPVLSAGGWVR